MASRPLALSALIGAEVPLQCQPHLTAWSNKNKALMTTQREAQGKCVVSKEFNPEYVRGEWYSKDRWHSDLAFYDQFCSQGGFMAKFECLMTETDSIAGYSHPCLWEEPQPTCDIPDHSDDWRSTNTISPSNWVDDATVIDSAEKLKKSKQMLTNDILKEEQDRLHALGRENASIWDAYLSLKARPGPVGSSSSTMVMVDLYEDFRRRCGSMSEHHCGHYPVGRFDRMYNEQEDVKAMVWFPDGSGETYRGYCTHIDANDNVIQPILLLCPRSSDTTAECTEMEAATVRSPLTRLIMTNNKSRNEPSVFSGLSVREALVAADFLLKKECSLRSTYQSVMFHLDVDDAGVSDYIKSQQETSSNNHHGAISTDDQRPHWLKWQPGTPSANLLPICYRIDSIVPKGTTLAFLLNQAVSNDASLRCCEDVMPRPHQSARADVALNHHDTTVQVMSDQSVGKWQEAAQRLATQRSQWVHIAFEAFNELRTSPPRTSPDAYWKTRAAEALEALESTFPNQFQDKWSPENEKKGDPMAYLFASYVREMLCRSSPTTRLFLNTRPPLRPLDSCHLPIKSIHSMI